MANTDRARCSQCAWLHSNSFSSQSFLCFGSRLRLSGISRVVAGTTPEARARRRASFPASKRFLLRFFTMATLPIDFSHASLAGVNLRVRGFFGNARWRLRRASPLARLAIVLGCACLNRRAANFGFVIVFWSHSQNSYEHLITS